jgi:hypothetical protein
LGWTAVALLSIINYCWARYSGLTFTDPEYSAIAVTVLISTSLLFYGIFGRSSRVGEMIRYLVLWITIFPIGRAFTYLVALCAFHSWTVSWTISTKHWDSIG